MSALQYPLPTRFRLRFMLQEFELQPGETLIGRSEECHITLFDPLISRRHARIRVFVDQAMLEDLGSRNGCRVNGILVRGDQLLSSGDRIRIGKHEFVFGEFASVSSMGAKERPTGSLVFCGACDTVYPGEMGMCPSCGSRHALDEEGRTGLLDEQSKQSWTIDLFLQLFERSLTLDRAKDADRVMRQVTATLEGYLSTGTDIDGARLEAVAHAAIRLSDLQDSGFWARWAADFHERAGLRISDALADAMARWDDDDPKTAQQ